mgnify:CR=1 FL=1
MENTEFKPILLSFDNSGYNRACREAQDKLLAIDKCLVWCANNGVYIKSKDLMSSFLSNPVQTFKDEWYRINSKKIELNVNVEKLLELCEIDIRDLGVLREGVRRYNAEIGIANDRKTKLFKYVSKVDKESYSHYTKSEKENDKVLKLKKFLNALEDVSEFTQVYPANIQQGLNNIIHYNISDNEYVINSSMFS